MAQDAVWFVYEFVLHILVLSTYVIWLKSLYVQHFNSLTIEALNLWPEGVRLVVGLLLTDFLYWVQHVANHKFSILWHFHKVHHSQRELNFFTDYRYHVVECLVRHTVLVIPFLFLQFDVPTIVALLFFQRWYSRFYHGNIRANLGVLRYLFVTPQSHRIHHAIDDQYQDKNFGSLFSIWDYIFRTQVRDYNVYPATGISDKDFQDGHSTPWWQVPLLPLLQMIYPFRQRIMSRIYRICN